MTSPGNRHNTWRLLCLLFLFAPAFAPVSAQESAVVARLATDTITLGDTVRLEVLAINAGEDLDTTALETDFDVTVTPGSRQVVQVNGQVTSRIAWMLELEPLKAGRLQVPAVRVGAFQSAPLTLTVNEPPVGAQRDVFVEMTADDTQPWVQAQVILTVRVYTAVDILDGALSSPAADALVVSPIGNDRRDVETRDGRTYQVTERRFAAFPQQSGEIVIDPILLTVSVGERAQNGGGYTRTRKVRRRSEAVTLSVRPRLADGSAWWLPASHVEISDDWSADPTALRVGQAVTRTITVRADGVGETQLPAIDPGEADGVNLYPDKPVRQTQAGDAGLSAQMQLSVAVIPASAGRWELPAITLDWFEVGTGEPRTATLPAVTVTVAPAENAAGVSPESGGQATPLSSGRQADDVITLPVDVSTAGQTVPAAGAMPGIWRPLAMVFAAGWLSTVLAWWWRSRRRSLNSAGAEAIAADAGAQSLSRAWSGLQRVCRDGNGHDIAGALLDWAALHWPEDPPRNLMSLAVRVGDSEAAASIAALDAALYRPDGSGAPGSVRADDLAPRLAELPTRLRGEISPRKASGSGVRADAPPADPLPTL